MFGVGVPDNKARVERALRDMLEDCFAGREGTRSRRYTSAAAVRRVLDGPTAFPPENDEHRARSTNQIQRDIISPGNHL